MKSKNENIRSAPYQLVPLTKLLNNGLHCVLICDGVGVGKTISAAYAILYLLRRSGKPCGVLCPPALLSKWMFELKSKFGITPLPVRSKDDLTTARDESKNKGRSSNVYIISNSLVIGTHTYEYPAFCLVVFDEVHNYRNSETQMHRGALELSKAAEWRIGLTATPINNSLNDLVSELSLLMPDFAWEDVQATTEDLWRTAREKLTSALVTRFLKEKLGIHFAAHRVTWERVSYPIEYATRVRALVRSIESSQSSFDAITYYRLAASSPAAFYKAMGLRRESEPHDPKLEVLRRALADPSIEHWLVFCEFKETVDYLSRMITERDVFTMTGETPIFERESTLDAFSKAHDSVLIMTSVGSEGLDMQFAQGIINYDLHWNPMKLEQRIGRIDRVGQEKTWIRIVNILVEGSIDERVLSVINKKLAAISGSIFAVDGIVESARRAEQLLYDSTALSEELSESEKLIRVLDQNRSISNKDYEVIKFFKPEYCQPGVMRHTAREGTPWIGSGKSSQLWLDAVREDGKRIRELLDYFA